jgi:hypothetical protein
LKRKLQTTQYDLKAGYWEFETQVAAKGKMRQVGRGNSRTSTDRVKPLKFDGSTSWAVNHCQL